MLAYPLLHIQSIIRFTQNLEGRCQRSNVFCIESASRLNRHSSLASMLIATRVQLRRPVKLRARRMNSFFKEVIVPTTNGFPPVWWDDHAIARATRSVIGVNIITETVTTSNDCNIRFFTIRCGALVEALLYHLCSICLLNAR